MGEKKIFKFKPFPGSTCRTGHILWTASTAWQEECHQSLLYALSLWKSAASTAEKKTHRGYLKPNPIYHKYLDNRFIKQNEVHLCVGLLVLLFSTDLITFLRKTLKTLALNSTKMTKCLPVQLGPEECSVSGRSSSMARCFHPHYREALQLSDGLCKSLGSFQISGGWL